METTTNEATAVPGIIYRGYTADFTGQIEYAVNADGVWFNRHQYRDPRYGYKWGAWRRGFSPDRLNSTGRKARLPKA